MAGRCWQVFIADGGQKYFFDRLANATSWDDPRLAPNANVRAPFLVWFGFWLWFCAVFVHFYLWPCRRRACSQQLCFCGRGFFFHRNYQTHIPQIRPAHRTRLSSCQQPPAKKSLPPLPKVPGHRSSPALDAAARPGPAAINHARVPSNRSFSCSYLEFLM